MGAMRVERMVTEKRIVERERGIVVGRSAAADAGDQEKMRWKMRRWRRTTARETQVQSVSLDCDPCK